MRVLVFHGYLLAGTGSNVYNARLAAALVKLGHEVHLLSQDRHPERQPFVDAAGDWDGGSLRLRELRPAPAGQARCTVYRPNIGGLLPVYVADRYEGIEARTFADCSDQEIERYVEANVRAVRELVERVSPDVALANHLVMGPLILARALGGEVPYAVKVHGSALEYTVKPEPQRFLPAAREGLRSANGILVGSHHTAASLWSALEEPDVERRTRLGPPGVDVERFEPRSREQAIAGVRELAERLRGEGERARQQRASEPPGGAVRADAFARDVDAAAERARRASARARAPRRVRRQADRQQGRRPAARLLAAGARARTRGDARRGRLRRLPRRRSNASARHSRAAISPRRASSRSPVARSRVRRERPGRCATCWRFSMACQASGAAHYLEAASELGERVVLTGRLEHDELADLLPACEAVIVPSTFPEAFGMVAAEAAACGALPISAAHSGLAEVSSALALAVPSELAGLLSFPVDDDAVGALAARVLGWLGADPAARERARAGLVETVRERWSWEGVARGVIAAARGELEQLQRP